MQHELLAVLVNQAINQLLVGAGAECDGAHRLRLAAAEDGRAVNAREHADFAADGTDRVVVAAVRTNAGQDRVARHGLFDFGEDIANLLGFVPLRQERHVRRVGVGHLRG